jgi:hypothetical protein
VFGDDRRRVPAERRHDHPESVVPLVVGEFRRRLAPVEHPERRPLAAELVEPGVAGVGREPPVGGLAEGVG